MRLNTDVGACFQKALFVFLLSGATKPRRHISIHQRLPRTSTLGFVPGGACCHDAGSLFFINSHVSSQRKALAPLVCVIRSTLGNVLLTACSVCGDKTTRRGCKWTVYARVEGFFIHILENHFEMDIFLFFKHTVVIFLPINLRRRRRKGEKCVFVSWC